MGSQLISLVGVPALKQDESYLEGPQVTLLLKILNGGFFKGCKVGGNAPILQQAAWWGQELGQERS